MITVEIVSHCQSIQRTFYSSLLTYQLSSLVLYPPTKCKVKVSICCTRKDERTRKVLDFFLPKLDLNIQYQTLGFLGRRSIGRNIIALNTTSDIVWFTDVDHVFHKGCLDSLVELGWPDKHVILFPNIVNVHKDFVRGDAAIQKALNPSVIDINIDDFRAIKISKATGAYQIVKGDIAREYGYVPNLSSTQTPTDGEFVRCRSDINYRRKIKRMGVVGGVNIKNVYRLRHPERNTLRVKRINRAQKRVEDREKRIENREKRLEAKTRCTND